MEDQQRKKLVLNLYLLIHLTLTIFTLNQVQEDRFLTTILDYLIKSTQSCIKGILHHLDLETHCLVKKVMIF